MISLSALHKRTNFRIQHEEERGMTIRIPMVWSGLWQSLCIWLIETILWQPPRRGGEVQSQNVFNCRKASGLGTCVIIIFLQTTFSYWGFKDQRGITACSLSLCVLTAWFLKDLCPTSCKYPLLQHHWFLQLLFNTTWFPSTSPYHDALSNLTPQISYLRCKTPSSFYIPYSHIP